MNDSQREETYRDLASALRDVGLAWVVNEVDSEIRQGRAVVRSGRARDEYQPLAPDASSVPSQYAEYSTSPFSAAEAALLLIEATRRAVVDTMEIEAALGSFLAQRAPDVEGIQFDGVPLEVRRTDSREGEATRELAIWLDELATQVRSDD